ncbi:MAG: hypothetical protein V4735_09285 [Pseudomonadota bacterium]
MKHALCAALLIVSACTHSNYKTPATAAPSISGMYQKMQTIPNSAFLTVASVDERNWFVTRPYHEGMLDLNGERIFTFTEDYPSFTKELQPGLYKLNGCIQYRTERRARVEYDTTCDEIIIRVEANTAYTTTFVVDDYPLAMSMARAALNKDSEKPWPDLTVPVALPFRTTHAGATPNLVQPVSPRDLPKDMPMTPVLATPNHTPAPTQ